ncbi:MAG: MaoC family dehydratase [bacterium]|nr:MaoC family dehydratase [bacterium]
MIDRYFDDFSIGEIFTGQAVRITEEEILSFARRFDPQPFHLDPEAAHNSPFGGLIASGFHTLLVSFRSFLDTGAISACSIGSPGLEELKWLVPVRPGDTLCVTAEVLEMRPSNSKPDRGILKMGYETKNQQDETVMTLRGLHLLKRNTKND